MSACVHVCQNEYTYVWMDAEPLFFRMGVTFLLRLVVASETKRAFQACMRSSGAWLSKEVPAQRGGCHRTLKAGLINPKHLHCESLFHTMHV